MSDETEEQRNARIYATPVELNGDDAWTLAAWASEADPHAALGNALEVAIRVKATRNARYEATFEHPHTCGAGEDRRLDPECGGCAVRDCPFDEPLHHHHDGCPACSFASEEQCKVEDSLQRCVLIGGHTGAHMFKIRSGDDLVEIDDRPRNAKLSDIGKAIANHVLDELTPVDVDLAEDIRIVRQLLVDFLPQTTVSVRGELRAADATICGDALDRFDRICERSRWEHRQTVGDVAIMQQDVGPPIVVDETTKLDHDDPEVGRVFNAICALQLGLVFSKRMRLAQTIVDYAREHRVDWDEAKS